MNKVELPKLVAFVFIQWPVPPELDYFEMRHNVTYYNLPFPPTQNFSNTTFRYLIHRFKYKAFSPNAHAFSTDTSDIKRLVSA